MDQKQPRICSMLIGTRCKHYSFLDFPEHVRKNIYRYAGFDRHDYIEYDEVRPGHSDDQPQPTIQQLTDHTAVNISAGDDEEYDEYSEGDSDDGHSSVDSLDLRPLWEETEIVGSIFGKISLMLCCRTMYHETAQMTYGKYKFSISKQPVALCRIRGSSIALLTSLTMDLHFAGDHSTPDHPDWSDPISPSDYAGRLHPLEISSPQASDLLPSWLAAASHLRQHLVPGRLSLSFTCDVDDYSFALMIASPLLALPRLNRCWLRLSAGLDPQIAQLARRVSRTCTGHGRAQEDQPFRYTDLPKEVQLLVLSFTDLVTPFSEIHWTPDEHYHLIMSQRKGTSYSDAVFSMDEEEYEMWVCHERTEMYGCFCRRHHSAYWEGCRCWSSPTPLFLVSKDFHSAAVEVFFRSNRFCILPSYSEAFIGDVPVEDPPSPLPVSTFLQSTVPPMALPHLRQLELVLSAPLRINDVCIAQLPHFLDELTRVVKLLKGTLHLPRLKLIVHMPDLSYDSEHIDRRAVVPERVLTIYNRMCETIALKLSALDGLQYFYAFIAEPLKWQIRLTAVDIRYADELIEELKITREREMEEVVMGQGYEASEKGKQEYVHSAWYCKNEGFDDY
ncbi:Hypothetical protein D9617_23g006230 [Elsinoe fawcettii]|nr:Hypothetical protein D9617_23g006230 [Elsinoe fawcettii]